MSTRPLLSTAALVLWLGAAGCRGDQPATRGDAGSPAQAPAPAAEPGAGVGSGATAESAGSGITAAAGLEERAAGVSLSLTLDGLVPGDRYPAQVREGTCADRGAIRLPLGRVTAAADGTGSVRMTVAADRLPDGPISVHVQSPDGSPVACANVDSGEG